MAMPWTLTITDLNAGGEDEVRSVVTAIADLLAGRGYQVPGLSFQPTGVDINTARRAGECSECGSRAGLHALSCSHYPGSEQDPEANHDPEPLSEPVLTALRRLQPYAWYAWPADSYDQGQPLVEVRQDHLAALLAEVQEARSG
jgi:LmbE family N-acetylglucosaminyl deacetylase